MKQLIVMIAMVILGIAIAGFVMGFETNAKTISDGTTSQITMDLYN